MGAVEFTSDLVRFSHVEPGRRRTATGAGLFFGTISLMKLLVLSALYQPAATDAVVLNPDGTVNGPANPAVFASQAEGLELIHDLEKHGILTVKRSDGGYVVHLLDEPNTEDGDFRYGADGRKVLVLQFPRKTGSGNIEIFRNNAQELYTEMKRLPSPGSVWAIITAGDGLDYLIRRGAIVG